MGKDTYVGKMLLVDKLFKWVKC